MRIKRALHLLDGVRKKDEIDEMLEDALKDEVGGYNFYVKLERILSAGGHVDAAKIIWGIAEDENRHYRILEKLKKTLEY